MADTKSGKHLQPTHISVVFKIVMPDKLRKISFSLQRDTDSDSDSWAITFQLFQRETIDADFPTDADIELEAKLDKEDQDANDQAAATAKHGLDSAQRAQALAAGDISQAANDPGSGITADDAKEAAVAVVTSRKPGSPT